MPKKTELKDTQSTQPEQVQQVHISDIHPFKNHPFKVVDDALMQETVDSIMQFGVLNPTIIRPDPGGGYEMVAGHRRLHASGLAGKDTIGQNQGVANIEISDKNIKDFDRVARKYGVDYAIKKDKTLSPPKYMVFFKARDADALTAAFEEYTRNTAKKRQKPSLIQHLHDIQAAKDIIKPAVKHKDKGLEL